VALDPLSLDFARRPFVLFDRTSDDGAEHYAGWRSDDITQSPHALPERRGFQPGMYAGTGSGAFYAFFALCDETEDQRVEELEPRDADLEIAATGPDVLAEFPALRKETQFQESDDAMTLLRAAADSGDEEMFVKAMGYMNWSQRSEETFVEAVRLALRAGAHRAARELAVEGVQRYPGNSRLQKMSRLLGPPRVLRDDLPPVPSLRANKAWMETHATEYRGQWIALREGELIASAPTARELRSEVGDLKNTLITRAV